MIAYKFVQWDIEPLKKLRDEDVYKLRIKVLDGKPLTRTEKDMLYRMLQHNSYSKTGVPLQGWMFQFHEVLKPFYVKQYDFVQEVYAPDKMSIRRNTYGKIQNITERQ